MLTLKGFAIHEQLADNTPGVVSKIGEISTQSLTYSRDKGYYNNAGAPAVGLVSFLAKRDDAAIRLPVGVANQAILIAKYVYDKTITSSNPIYQDELLNDLIDHFAAEADNFACGDIVQDDSGRYYAPAWVSWQSKTAGEENRIKIWMSDPAFMAQYDEYAITVIPPMENLNDFFRPGNDVEVLLKARTYPEEVALIQAAKDGKPETIVRAEVYDYVDPFNNAHRVPSKWTVLIYGAAGDNIDTIKDALVDYILENSDHTRDEWKDILPDLFRRTEVVMMPLWSQYAIPNRVTQEGIYSPFVQAAPAMALLKTLVPDYAGSHVDTYGSFFGHTYRSLVVAAIGGPENRDDKFRLVDFYPDYISVSTASVDFIRMSAATRAWAIALDQMIQVAEKMGDFTDIPIGMTRLTRNGALFLVKSIDNVHFLVAAKKNFPQPD